MKRIFDVVAAFVMLIFLSVPMLAIALIIRSTSRGPVIHATVRVGLNNTNFTMYKFRTMILGTPQVATHLLTDANKRYTYVGRFLRAIALDELPQLINILKGDMSFVGPRPALFNQYDLIEQRTGKGIDKLVPGLTGWAQIKGSTYMPIPDKVLLDEYYLDHRSFLFDLKIMWMTLLFVTTVAGNVSGRCLQRAVRQLVGEHRHGDDEYRCDDKFMQQ